MIPQGISSEILRGRRTFKENMKYLKKQIRRVRRSLVEIAKIDMGELTLGMAKIAVRSLKFSCTQFRIRPRARLISILVIILAFAFEFSNAFVAYLKPKEAEIKINGRAILVAEKNQEPGGVQGEISQHFISKRSPFEFQKPVEGYLSQGYSFYHRAIDIAAPLSSPVQPLGHGVVESAGRAFDGKGNVVIVDHGDGLKSLYAHMGKIYVGVGNQVTPETKLGTVGLTGRTTGPHVHLEIYDNGVMVNPASVLP